MLAKIRNIANMSAIIFRISFFTRCSFIPSVCGLKSEGWARVQRQIHQGHPARREDSERRQVRAHIHIDRKRHMDIAWQRQLRVERAIAAELERGPEGVVWDVRDLTHLEKIHEVAGDRVVVICAFSRSCGVCKRALAFLESMSREVLLPQPPTARVFIRLFVIRRRLRIFVAVQSIVVWFKCSFLNLTIANSLSTTCHLRRWVPRPDARMHFSNMSYGLKSLLVGPCSFDNSASTNKQVISFGRICHSYSRGPVRWGTLHQIKT
jgi:hypothetical protein